MLLLVTLGHALVDAFAGMVQPLWPDLQDAHGLGDAGSQAMVLLWTLSTSLSQLIFGYWGDRLGGRWLLVGGMAVGIAGVSGVGLAPSSLALATLLVVGGLGIAAFHPEAAATAGSSTPGERSRAMSLFAVGGFVGQAAGPVYSGVVSTRYGMPALVWSGVWGLVALGWLAAMLGRTPAPAADHPSRPSRRPVSLVALMKGRGRGVGLMLAVGALRVLPGAGVPLALAYLIKARGGSNEPIGVAQAAFMIGIGAGSLGCALFVRGHDERRLLWALPLAGVPLLLICPVVGYGALLVSLATFGVLLGVVSPILIGYGQRLLHEGQRVASSLTMGVSWGLGGIAVAGLMAGVNRAGRPDWAFPVFAVAVLLSSVLCGWLPEPDPAPS